MMNLRVLSAVIALMAMATSVLAQYPRLSSEEAAQAAAKAAEAEKHSDEAWARALPLVQEWAAKGRPYLPRVNGPDDFVTSQIPAFPGADGPAAYTVGGRGGKVYVVTSLEDSGPGTFREALEAGGPRIVVFNVSGIIKLNNKIRVRAPYITIAGNTAPGDGVCIAGDTVELETHDILIRHMRFRRGNTSVIDRNDSLGGNPIGNVMIDHVSASWGLDENISIYRYVYMPPGETNRGGGQKRPTVNVTIQWSISSEALNKYNHSFASTIGGQNNAFHHNLWACNAGRNPSLSMGASYNWINNVVFNWRHRTMDGLGAGSALNQINNYYKPGPVTPTDEPIGHRLVKLEGGGRAGGTPGLYVTGNIVEGNEKVTADNWAGGVQIDEEDAKVDPAIAALKENLMSFRATKPRSEPTVRTIHSAREAYELVLAHAGATLPKRDAVDTRVVETVRSGKPTAKATPDIMKELEQPPYSTEFLSRIADMVSKGIITDPEQVGGYPQYEGEPYKDTDGDGMPDAWETKHGLNPNDAADSGGDINGDGYTNIEKFIHGLDPTKKIDWKDPKNQVDPLMAIDK